MRFWIFGKAKRSSSSGPTDIEPPTDSAAVREAHRKYGLFAEVTADTSSKAFIGKADNAIEAYHALGVLEEGSLNLELEITQLESELSLKQAFGGAVGDLPRRIAALRTQKGRIDAQRQSWAGRADASSREVKMRRERLIRDFPRRHGRDKWR